MNVNKILVGVFSVIICAIVFSATLPVYDSVGKEVYHTENNTTAYYVSDTDIDETLVFTCDPDTDEFFVNGVSIDWRTESVGSQYRQIFVFTNAVAISFGEQHQGFTFASLDFPAVGTSGAVKSLTINADGTWSALSLNGATTYDGITLIDWAIYPSENGTLGCYALDFNVTKGGEAIIINGTKNITVEDKTGFLFSKTSVIDGVATTVYSKTIVDGAISDIEIDVIASGEMKNGYYHYNGGYTLSSDSFNETITRGGVIFAPIEYKYISSSDSVVINMLGFMPIIAIAGLVIASVYVFISRK